jgi:hypothetical protein
VRSDYRTGRVDIRWRDACPFDFARLKATLFTWRGGMRFRSAQVVATGIVEADGDGVALRVEGGGHLQRFALRAGRAGLPPIGARVRLAGEVSLPRAGPRRASGAGAAAPDLIVTVTEYERRD